MAVYVGSYSASDQQALNWSDPVVAFLEHVQLQNPETGTFSAIVAGTFLLTPTVTDMVVSSMPNY